MSQNSTVSCRRSLSARVDPIGYPHAEQNLKPFSTGA
jgi:hypothetical protein